MQNHYTKAIFGSLVALSFTTTASAQLLFNVDTVAKEYYISGSATGAVIDDGWGVYSIAWAIPVVGGNHIQFLGSEAFRAEGNSPNGLYAIIYFDGSILIEMFFPSAGPVTLTGNPEVRFNYAGWDSSLVTIIENYAFEGRYMRTFLGSPDFGMTFVAVPEPSSYVALIGGVTLAGAMMVSRRRRSDLK